MRQEPDTRRSLRDLTFSDLERELVLSGLPRVHARALWRSLHRDATCEAVEERDFVPPLRRWLAENCGDGRRFHLDGIDVAGEVSSNDGRTRKLLLRLDDGETIETVVMGYRARFTACLSTQVGCAMGCGFCATGQMGFVRHLRAGEIVAQVHHARRALHSRGESGLRNLVLMGMGEPLHNYDSVMTALEIISDRRGLNIGPSRITISTVGVVPGILRLADEAHPYHLAVSLHAATDEERSALVPVNRRWPLAGVLAACRFYAEKTGRRIFFEWTLIAGKNDSLAQAARLAGLLAGIPSHVNLIPLNPTADFTGVAADSRSAVEFQRVLRAAGVPSTVRQRRGIDVAAGCGQLRAGSLR